MGYLQPEQKRWRHPACQNVAAAVHQRQISGWPCTESGSPESGSAGQLESEAEFDQGDRRYFKTARKTGHD